MKFSDLPHIFVVFHPGSSGNFITGLLTKLIQNNLTDLSISSAGSAHQPNQELLSFGYLFDNYYTLEREERIKYHLSAIHECQIDTPQVMYTHNFANIPLYREVYPNSKIIVITLDSQREKVISLIFLLLKNALNPDFDFDSYLPINQVKHYVNVILKEKFVNGLSQYRSLDRSLCATLYENRFYGIEKDIMFGILFSQNYQRLKLNLPGMDTINHIQEIDMTGKKSDVAKQPYSDFIDENCILLPFCYIIDNRGVELINIIEEICGPLNDDSKLFVNKNLQKYVSAQNQEILKDTSKFLNESRLKTENFFKNLKN